MKLALAWRLACYLSGTGVIVLAMTKAALNPSLLVLGGGTLIIPGMIRKDERKSADRDEVGKPDYTKIARLERELLDGEPPRPAPDELEGRNCEALGREHLFTDQGTCALCWARHSLADTEPELTEQLQ